MAWCVSHQAIITLAVVLVLLILVLVLLILVLILLILLVLLVVLILVILLILLVIHSLYPPLFLYCGRAATLICPKIQALSLALKIRLANSPLMIAAVMPPAVDLSPPVNTPSKPSLSTASFTPLARQ